MKSLKIFLILSILLLPVNIELTDNSMGEDNVLDEEAPSRGQMFFNNDTYEYRSMWLEGYQIVNISEVKAVVELARRYNFNVLSPLINGDYRGVFYNSSYFGKHPDIRWDFDPLMSLIREAHKYGIQVHPWWHTLYSYPILRNHPEWRSQTSYGSYSSTWINPAIPEAREYVRDVTLEVVKNYPIDGIKLDTIRYGGSSYSYDAYSLAKYQEEDGEDFNRWRRTQITETVELIYDSIMEVKPWFWVGADVFSSSWGRMTSVFQEPELWANMGIIDYITPMIYTTSYTSYNSSLKNDVQNVNCPVVGGTYIYIPGNTAHGNVPSEEAGIELMLREVNTAQYLDAWGICAFAYKFLRQYPSYGQALLDGPFSEDLDAPIKEQNIPTKRSMWTFEKDHDREGWNLYDAGYFYPTDGVWSISLEKAPKMLSPRINITAEGVNVIEISALVEENVNCTLEIYWGQMAAVMDKNRMTQRRIQGDGEWALHSIHLDESMRWNGVITYLVIVPRFEDRGNITIDQISLHWMPYCIRECSYIGPFTVGGDEGLMEREFIENEGSIKPRLGDINSGRMWKEFSMERDLMDFRFPLGHMSYSVVYSHVYVISEFEQEVMIRTGSSDSIKVWLNGERSLSFDGTRSVFPDQNTSTVNLREGYNSLFFKLGAYSGDLSVFIRFTDLSNNTLDSLTYANNIEVMDEPEIGLDNGTWFSSRDVTFDVDVIDAEAGMDHLEIFLDGETLTESDSRTIQLKDLSNGYHEIGVRAIDTLGFSSEVSFVTIGVDHEIPVLDGPFSPAEYVTEPSIEWKWMQVNEPISGIDHYRLDIEYGPLDSPGYSRLDPIITNDTSYKLTSRISDGNIYSMKVTAFSVSGMNYVSGYSDGVTVDLLSPLPPTTLETELIDTANRTFMISWDGASDNLGNEGLFYIISVIEDGVETRITTDLTSFMYRRKIGCIPQFTVMSVDAAGNIGDPSKTYVLENILPVLEIDPTPSNRPGEIFVLNANRSYDPDGMITGYQWKIDDVNVSNDPHLEVTIESGHFIVDLLAFDDAGGVSEISFYLDLDDPEFIENGTLRGWLINKSFKEHMLPPINITIPVYPEPEIPEPDPLISTREGYIRISLLTIICIFLLSVLFYFGVFIRRTYVGSKTEFIVNVKEKEEETDELGRPIGWSTGLEESSPRLNLGVHTDAPGLRPPSIYDIQEEQSSIEDHIFIDDMDLMDDDLEDDVDIQDDEYDVVDIEDWEDIEFIEEMEEFEDWEDIDEMDEDDDIDDDDLFIMEEEG